MKNREINKLKREILKAFLENRGRWKWTLDGLDRQLKQTREVIVHAVHLLEDDKEIIVRGQEIQTEMIYEITSLGRQQFDPWYKKTFRFLTDDFAKILSVISIVLSIAASLIAWFK